MTTEAAGPGLREVLEVMKSRYKTPSYELQTGRGAPTQEERDVLSLIFEVERLLAALAEAKDDAPGHCENCRAVVPLTTVHLCATCLPAAPSEHRAALVEAGRSSLPIRRGEIMSRETALQVLIEKLKGVVRGFENEAMNGIICTPPCSENGGVGWGAPVNRTWCSRCKARWERLRALPAHFESALLLREGPPQEKRVQEARAILLTELLRYVRHVDGCRFFWEHRTHCAKWTGFHESRYLDETQACNCGAGQPCSCGLSKATEAVVDAGLREGQEPPPARASLPLRAGEPQ